MITIAPDIQKQWIAIAPLLTIRNEQDYDRSIAQLNELLDEVGTNEKHPLYSFLDTLGIIIQAYEAAHYPLPTCSGTDALAYLIEENGLTPSDLSEIGSEATLNKILSGDKALEIDQVRALANRFKVSAAVFV